MAADWIPAFAGMTGTFVAPAPPPVAPAPPFVAPAPPFVAPAPPFVAPAPPFVAPAKAGAQADRNVWMPAFAGMTGDVVAPVPPFVAPAKAGAQLWCLSLLLLLLCLAAPAVAQSLDQQKSGVVKITSQTDDLRRTGTGFVVRVEKDAAFILTASHVVEGDNKPRVEFFARRNSAVPAEVLRIEGGDPRGLALLVVRGKESVPPDLQALPVAGPERLVGGEPVTVIGFPQGGGAWAVLRASVVSQEGRELTLDGSIGEGNSGGPVLREGRVIGVVTTVGGGGGFGRALPATLIRLVLDGWGVTLADVPASAAQTASSDAPQSPRRSGASGDPSDPEQSPPRHSGESRNPPGPSGAANPNSGLGQASVIRAVCESMQTGGGMRITLYGEAAGPEGSTVRVMLVRDGKEIVRANPACGDWKSCVRQKGGPEKTDWTVRSMIFPPAPTDVNVYVQDAVRGNADNAYARVSAETRCLLQ